MGILENQREWWILLRLNGPLKSKDFNEPSCNNFVSQVSSHVLYTNSNQKSDFLDLENKLDRFWDLESIATLDNEKHSKERFTESIYLKKKNR